MKAIETGPIEIFELEYTCKKNNGYRYDRDGCKTVVLLEDGDIFCQLMPHPSDDDASVLKYAYICPECGKIVVVPDILISKQERERCYDIYLKEDHNEAWKMRKKEIEMIKERQERMRVIRIKAALKEVEERMERYRINTQER